MTGAMPRPALWLGLAGLLPFLIAAAAVWAPDPATGVFALRLLATYAAVILSFLGGVRWGAVLRDDAALQRWTPLTLSVLPSLVAWCALLLPGVAMLGLLFAGLILQLTLDAIAARDDRLPAWYGQLRSVLSAGAIGSVASGLIAALLRSPVTA